jgi:hypothetical protein
VTQFTLHRRTLIADVLQCVRWSDLLLTMAEMLLMLNAAALFLAYWLSA